jgi:dipeptidyl aminopeptidase/acylaminoacyl peptidase
MRRAVLPLALGLAISTTIVAQTRVFQLPANITVDGIPPIPMSIVEAVAPYGQFRAAKLVAWHPGERRMVISTRFGNAFQLHAVQFPGGARTQLTFYPDGLIEPVGAAFTPKGESLIFQKDTASGGEALQLFRYDVAGGSITLLTDGKSRNAAPGGAPLVSPSGLIAYESTRRDRKNYDLYVVDPRKPESDRMFLQAEGVWLVLDWSVDERHVLAMQVISSAERYLWKVSVPGGEKTLLTPKGERPTRWSSAGFAPDGSVYALGNLNGENNRIWRFAQERWTALTAETQSIDSFALSPDGRTIAAVVDLGATMRLQLLDTAGRARPTPALAPGVVTDLRWHPNGSELGFSFGSGRMFSDVYSIDIARQRVDRWTFSEMGGANPQLLPDAEIVKWKSFDGLEVSGVLYKAPAKFSGPRPVIINVHGGPAAVERPRALGRTNYFRNEMGISIIYPNVRGSLGFGRTFEALDNGRLRENAIKDIGALLDWIATQPSLDKSRVLITGPSYGGYVSLAAAIEYPDRIKAAVPAFAPTDFPSFLESTDMSRQANRNAEYGDPADADMRAYLTRISPLTNVSRLKAPVFITAGAKDPRVPISQAEAMVKALKANGTPVWYLRLEDAGHLLLTATATDVSFWSWVMFTQKYLLD